MDILGLPDLRDPNRMADWVEMQLLVQAGGTFSAEDLKGFLSMGGGDVTVSVEEQTSVSERMEPVDIMADMLADMAFGEADLGDTPEATEEPDDTTDGMVEDLASDALADTVFEELATRADAAAVGYPFTITDRTASLCEAWQDRVPYMFCLLLSYLARETPAEVNAELRKLFEYVAAEAARHFLGGRVLCLGTPRDGVVVPKPFPEAIGKVIAELGEGRAFRDPGGAPQDDQVDIVAWRPFADGGPGKLILFGNCATTASRADLRRVKAHELTPKRFVETWFSKVPASPLVSALFVPHRLCTDEDDFYMDQLARGVDAKQIVFERCRIAHCAQPSHGALARHREWVEATLTDVAAE